MVKSKNGKIDLKALLKILGKRKIMSLIIEGGAKVFTSALKAKIVDKVMVFVAPKLVDSKNTKTWYEGLGIASMKKSLQFKNSTNTMIGMDVLVEGYLK